MRLSRRLLMFVFCGLAPLSVALANADEVLTLDQALTRARERAPSVLSARARIEEARARLGAASRLLRENPEIEAAAGKTISGADPQTKVDAGLIQNFQIGGRRSARIGAARSELDAAIAGGENQLREASRDVAVTFFRALESQKRVTLAADAEKIAEDVLDLAWRRHEAGDAALLDVNLARVAASRARTETQAARATLVLHLRDLRVLLALPLEQPLVPSGELRLDQSYALSALLAKAAERPDLQALRAGVQAAEAELDFAEALAWPELGLGAIYEREEGRDYILGAVRLTLPIFDRGQYERSETSVRLTRLRLELQDAILAVHSEVAAAFEVHRLQNAAVEELERNALPLLDDNEALSRESYEAGQISLVELLLARREVLDARVDYLARLLDAAVAAAELEASAGVLR